MGACTASGHWPIPLPQARLRVPLRCICCAGMPGFCKMLGGLLAGLGAGLVLLALWADCGAFCSRAGLLKCLLLSQSCFLRRRTQMSVVKEAIRICHSEERRARCGFQLIMSFGARGNDDGSPLIFDGESVGSGMDVVNQVHEFLSHFLFGSIEEGTRHIYFDWHNLKGLPGTKEVPKPKGTGIMRLNDEWKELYYEAFKQAKIKIFLISDAWLNSPNCMEEVRLATTLPANYRGSFLLPILTCSFPMCILGAVWLAARDRRSRPRSGRVY